jgi:hypothetical protein
LQTRICSSTIQKITLQQCGGLKINGIVSVFKLPPDYYTMMVRKINPWRGKFPNTQKTLQYSQAALLPLAP